MFTDVLSNGKKIGIDSRRCISVSTWGSAEVPSVTTIILCTAEDSRESRDADLDFDNRRGDDLGASVVKTKQQPSFSK